MKKVNEEIEKTMASLEGIESAAPSPFFYTRLRARLENSQAIATTPLRWALKPVFVFGLLAVILLLNVVSAVNYSKKLSQKQGISKQSIDGFEKEYGLDGSATTSI